jgi:hypothetical protein
MFMLLSDTALESVVINHRISANIKSSYSFTSRFIVTVLNNVDFSASVLMYLPAGNKLQSQSHFTTGSLLSIRFGTKALEARK